MTMGDPTWLGWFTTVAYVVAAGSCARAARAVSTAELHRRRLACFWVLLALLLFALGVNKQLDAQTHFVNVMRDVAREQGWYHERQRYQRVFVLVLGGVSVLGACALSMGLLPVWRRVRLALFGLVVLAGFVLLRAAYFQHVGPAWLMHVEPLHAWLELLGIGTLGWAATRATRATTRVVAAALERDAGSAQEDGAG